MSEPAHIASIRLRRRTERIPVLDQFAVLDANHVEHKPGAALGTTSRGAWSVPRPADTRIATVRGLETGMFIAGNPEPLSFGGRIHKCEVLEKSTPCPCLDSIAFFSNQKSERYRSLSEGYTKPSQRDAPAEHRELMDAALNRNATLACSQLADHFTRTTQIILDSLDAWTSFLGASSNASSHSRSD